jgi:hypothetical protein
MTTRAVTVADFFGNGIARIRAVFAGNVFYVVAAPPNFEGEPVAMVAAARP